MDDVWVLYRLNNQSCLIIGVFESREAAFAYTGSNGPSEQSGWIAPHPGQRHWQYDTDLFTYFLEKHQIRHGAVVTHDATQRYDLSAH